MPLEHRHRGVPATPDDGRGPYSLLEGWKKADDGNVH